MSSTFVVYKWSRTGSLDPNRLLYRDLTVTDPLITWFSVLFLLERLGLS